ncbi:MAG: family transcriptional regulator [Devosia sp.]|jgi:transcriptional regulator with XRE-family HTH domain|nr:family transcriptional regulator [Devosia sp.]
MSVKQSATVGDLLREWRGRRRFSQLDLASEAEVSTRHLSFVERGRSTPSRDFLMKLAEPLDLPLRERNRLLLAGGYAPMHTELDISAPDMAMARLAVETVLRGHEPFPALAVDRHWNLVEANNGAQALLEGIDPGLLSPPINVLRASLHPKGLTPHILNLPEWRHHVLSRLRSDAGRSADPDLASLHEELRRLPTPAGSGSCGSDPTIAVPLRLRHPKTKTVLSFISTTTVFGSAVDVTLAELTLECFYPADETTREALQV